MIDDIQQKTSLIIRGEDLFCSTARQEYLRQQLAAKNKIVYLHHPLLYEQEKNSEKLSKRIHSSSLRELRDKYSLAELLSFAASKVGLVQKGSKISPRDISNIFMDQFS